jgi:hypothetical protein
VRRKGAAVRVWTAVVAAGLGILPGVPASASPASDVIMRVAGNANGSNGFEAPGVALSSALDYPYQIDSDANGDLYVADLNNLQVAKITPGGNLATIAGTGASGPMAPGVATSSPFRGIQAIAVDSAGNVFVGDPVERRVAKIATNGQLSYFAGTGVAGTPVAGTATSQPVRAISMAIDPSDNLYISNGTPQLILKVTPAGQLSVFAGTGTSGVNVPGPATSSPMAPYMIAADGAGNVYAGDVARCTILKITPGGTLSIVAGNGTCLNTSPTYGSANTALPHPSALDVDSAGNVYVSTWDNGQIYKITTSGVLSLVAGSGTRAAPTYGSPALTTDLKAAESLVVNDAGVIYLAESDNNTIDRIGPETPSAPRDVQATPHGTALELSFLPPIDPGTSPILGYEASIDGGVHWQTIAVTPTGGRLVGTFTGVSASSFQVLVRALNTTGASANSTAVSVGSGSGSAQLPVTGAAIAGTAGIGLVLLVLGIGLVRALGGRRHA